MNYGEFIDIVDEHLGVDANRRGTENLRARAARNAVIDLQRFIRAYRQGHTTVYTEADLVVKTCAHLGSLPSQAKPKAFYIYQVAAGVSPTPLVNDAVESWADLAALVTLGRALPYTVLWVESSTGLFKVTQLRAGTDATDTANGIQRPNDYGVGNQVVWYQVSA